MNTIVSGLIKGAIVGLGVGIVFAVFDTGHHMVGTKFILFAMTGLLCGILCGTPIWRKEALTSNMIKAATGVVIGLLAMALLYYVLDVEWGTRRLSSYYWFVASVFGAMFGAFVEFDDGRP